MPKSVGDINFVTPGEAFGNTNATGSMIVPLNATIDFGVTYDSVNGTLFPYSDQRSMWGWWDRPVFGADFDAPNLMNKPTTSAVDQLAFVIHFAANQTLGSDVYNQASMKIDQRVGNWNLDPDVIDGRIQNSSGVMVPLRGNDVLSNRSLAINYYVTASSSMAWDVMDERGSSVDNNNVTESSRFDIGSRIGKRQLCICEVRKHVRLEQANYANRHDKDTQRHKQDFTDWKLQSQLPVRCRKIFNRLRHISLDVLPDHRFSTLGRIRDLQRPRSIVPTEQRHSHSGTTANKATNTTPNRDTNRLFDRAARRTAY